MFSIRELTNVEIKQESRGAYSTADKKSIKLRVNRWYTVQNNEIRKHIFL